MPLFIRKFIVDFVETAITAVLALNVAFPNDVNQAKQVALVVGLAIIAALVSAVRRNSSAFVDWLKSVLGVAVSLISLLWRL